MFARSPGKSFTSAATSAIRASSGVFRGTGRIRTRGRGHPGTMHRGEADESAGVAADRPLLAIAR